METFMERMELVLWVMSGGFIVTIGLLFTIICDIKQGNRMNSKFDSLDKRLEVKFENMNEKFDAKIDALREKIEREGTRLK